MITAPRTALVSAVALVAALAFAPAAHAGDGTALLSHAPSEGQFVVSFDIAQLRGTPLFDHLLETAQQNNDTQQLLTELQGMSFDPAQHLDTVVLIASNLQSRSPEDFIILLQGTFQRQQVETALAGQEGMTTGEAGGKSYITDNTTAISFLSDSVVAVGPHGDMMSLLGSESTGVTGRLQTLIGNVDKSRNIWFAAVAPPELVQNQPESERVEAIRGSFNVTNGLQANFGITTASEAAAASTVQQLNVGLQQAANQPQVAALNLQGILSSVTASAAGSDVNVGLQIDQETWNQLMITLSAILGEELR